MLARFTTCCFLICVAFTCVPMKADDSTSIERLELLPPSKSNPRNSEGDFIQLKDGKLLFIYTHYTGGAADHSTAKLSSRTSLDGGASWSQTSKTTIENHAEQNIMSVSLLRLTNGSIALFYLVKNSTSDCRPVVRISHDEAATWSAPVTIIPDKEIGYYVLNNDRVIQTSSGRLLLAVAQHPQRDKNHISSFAKLVCYYSDDLGKTWTRTQTVPDADLVNDKKIVQQEPGLIELKDNRIMMFVRTSGGSQFLSYSNDNGISWTQLKPGNLISPVSPATIERLPQTGELLAVWNDHANISSELKGKRTPLTVAVSSDEGQSWKTVGNLYTKPSGWYCYTALEFVGDHVVLGHCAGDRNKNNGLAQTNITRFPVKWVLNAAQNK